MSAENVIDTRLLEARGLTDTNGEIRLLVDTNTLSSFRIEGDFEGRTMEMNTAEDGMTELVISSSHDPRYQARHNTASVHEAGSARDRRVSALMSSVEAGDLQGCLYTEQAKLMPNGQKRDAKVHYSDPAVFDDSSDDDFTEDETSKASISPRRRRFAHGRQDLAPSHPAYGDPLPSKRPPRRRRPVTTPYRTSPRPASGCGHPSGPTIIQPAVGTKPRGPTGTVRQASYSGEPGPQYHELYAPADDRSNQSAPSAFYPQETHVSSWSINAERAHANKEQARVSLDPVYATVDQTSSLYRESSGNSALPAQPALHPTSHPQPPIPSRYDLRPEKVTTDNHLQRDEEPSHKQSRTETPLAEKEKIRVLARELARSVEEALIQQEQMDFDQKKNDYRNRLYGKAPISPYPHEQKRRPSTMRLHARTAFKSCTNEDALGDTVVDANVINVVGLADPSNSSAHGHGTIDTWLDARVTDDNEDYPAWDYGDSMSGPSSYAASIASVFSVASLASSASDMSRGSGYSAVQIATATKVLLAIFYEDETLLSLYKCAIENQAIGPARLQRNLRRLFRAYAGLLEGEATERLEYLASRLVLIKSAMLAQSIVEKLQNGRAALPLSRKERNEESSDEEEDVADVRPVNEDAFEDLAIFREFLVESEAFKTFRVQLQAFIVPKSTHLTHLESARSGDIANAAITEAQEMTSTWQNWRNDSEKSTGGFFGGAYGKIAASSVLLRMTDAFMSATDDVMIAAGLLEPPLRPDTVRLRWQCVCTPVGLKVP